MASSAAQGLQLIKTPSSRRKVDRLRRLPPELLNQIFDKAYAEKPPARPICRALLPFLRERLYRNVVLRNYDQLVCFMWTVVHEAAIGALVKSLDLDFWDDENGEPEPDTLRPSDGEMVGFLCALARLEALEIRGWSRASALVLSPAMANLATFLPSLRRLHLFGVVQGCVDLFQPAQLIVLHYYGQIVDFQARSAYWPVAPPAAVWKASPVPVPAFSSITRLGADLQLGPAGLLLLLPLLPNLADLSLTGVTSTACLDRLLSLLVRPNRIQSLEAEGFIEGGVWGLPGSLLLLTSLQSLEVAFRCVCDAAFFDVVRRLPIRRLRLADGLDVKGNDLFDLVSGPSRHQSLVRLVLDTMESGEVGEWVDRHNFADYYMFPSDADQLPDSWDEPEWPPSCDSRMVDELARLAEANGVGVAGSTFAALEVQRECDIQYDMLQIIADEMLEGDMQTECEDEDEDEDESDFE
ncbi:hypothetical protein JCM10449v2_002965 [Rhodotorula kratochvilovae]